MLNNCRTILLVDHTSVQDSDDIMNVKTFRELFYLVIDKGWLDIDGYIQLLDKARVIAKA